jgi:hypothetical protein
MRAPEVQACRKTETHSSGHCRLALNCFQSWFVLCSGGAMKEIKECPCMHVQRYPVLLVKCRQADITVVYRVRSSKYTVRICRDSQCKVLNICALLHKVNNLTVWLDIYLGCSSVRKLYLRINPTDIETIDPVQFPVYLKLIPDVTNFLKTVSLHKKSVCSVHVFQIYNFHLKHLSVMNV